MDEVVGLREDPAVLDTWVGEQIDVVVSSRLVLVRGFVGVLGHRLFEWLPYFLPLRAFPSNVPRSGVLFLAPRALSILGKPGFAQSVGASEASSDD